MHTRKKLWGVLVLAIAFSSIAGALTIASAACGTFSVGATPNPQRPDLGVTLNVSNFHDEFFNCISGKQLNVFVKQPGDADFPTVATGQTTVTNTGGNATFAFSATSLYDTYVAEVRDPVNPSVKATTSFSILPGPAVGTYTIAPTNLQPADIVAGTGTSLLASGLVDDQGKPVHNGTTVGWTLSPGSAGPACYLARPTRSYSATTTGVSGSANTATATKAAPGTDLQVAGKYDLDSAADSATKHEDDALIIKPANVATLAATAPATARPGSLQTLGVQNAKDAFGNPVGPSSNAQFRFTLHNSRDTDVVYQNIASSDCGAATVNHQFGLVPTDDPFYGIYSWTARSQDAGAQQNAVNIDVEPGNAFDIASAVANGVIVAGHDGQVLINGIEDDLGFAAKTGTPVALSIKNPSSVTSNIGTQNVAGVDSGNDVAGVSFTIPGAALTQAGDYSAQVTSQDAVKNFIFTVIPATAVVDMVISAPDIVVGAASTVAVTAIPSVAKTVSLRVTRPDGSSFTRTATAEEPPIGNGSFDGQASFALTDADLDQTGLWGVSALAKDGDDVSVGIAAGTFTVTPRVLGVTLNTVNPNPMNPGGASRTITVSNLPTNAASAQLLITRPDATTLTLSATRPSTVPPPGGWASGSTTFTLANTQILKAGTWTIAASALNAGNAAIGSGNNSFQVRLPVSGANKNLGEAGSVVVTNIPIKSGATVASLVLTKPDASTVSLSQTPTGQGGATFALSAATLGTVGVYNAIVTIKDGTTTLVVGGATFTVSIAPDALTASLNPTTVGSLGGKTTLTAVATKAGVPVANRKLDIVVTHVLTGIGTGHFVVATNGLGQVIQVFIGSVTQYPGDYVVTVRDAGNSALSTTATFTVDLLQL